MLTPKRRFLTAIALTITLVLLVVVAVNIALRRPATILARYSSSGGADGGYTLLLDSAGHCHGYPNNRRLPENETVGRYHREGARLRIEMRPLAVTGVRRLIAWYVSRRREMLWLVQTNGVEYLVRGHLYESLQRTGDTNLLSDQLRRVESTER